MIARFGRYEAIEVLGRGGMGVVYRGVDTVIGRTVAVKTVLLDEGGRSRAGELHERLIREVKAAGALQHPNIITIYDMGVENGAPYIVMELIRGRGLDAVLAERKLPVDEMLRILREAARALDFAHANGVIHRDVKPGNILIAADGAVKLADFGIAKIAGTRTMTEKGMVVGSVAYMGPESLRGEAPSAASDRYSLAVMAYSMMTGRMPFEAESMGALITSILTVEAPAAREVNPWLPPGVDAVLARGLAKAAGERYASCAAFVEAIEQACRPAVSPMTAPMLPAAPPVAPPPPAPPPVAAVEYLAPTEPLRVSQPDPDRVRAGHSRRFVAIGGVALVGIAVAGWLWTRLGRPEIEPRELVVLPPVASQQPAAGSIRENPRDGLKYVWIAAGRFRMGCSAGDGECEGDEKPAREVEITRGFWMGQTEVTQSAYQKVIGANPSNFKGPTLPVEQVNWTEANAYCAAVGMRLPTEAEWEYAARGGSAGSRYGEVAAVAWYSTNGGGMTHPVGEKQANGYGLYDVLGNVWEWVWDWYEAQYPESGVARDPQGPTSGQQRALRGGSWYYVPQFVRASDRGGLVPTYRNYSIGFRCVGELR